MANQTTTITEFIDYSGEYEVLICCICQFCIDPARVNRHLFKYHYSFGHQDRMNILTSINDRNLTFADPAAVTIPEPLKYYFSQLKLTTPEYFTCHLCHQYVTKSEKWLREHYYNIHQLAFT